MRHDRRGACAVFDPFFTTKATGSGLGSQPSTGSSKQSGGAIEVQTDKGGERASIVLPLVAATHEAGAVVAFAPRGTPKGSLLVVEDEPALRTLVSEA